MTILTGQPLNGGFISAKRSDEGSQLACYSYSLLCYYGIQTIEMRGQRDAYTLDLRQRIVAAYQAGEQSGK